MLLWLSTLSAALAADCTDTALPVGPAGRETGTITLPGAVSGTHGQRLCVSGSVKGSPSRTFLMEYRCEGGAWQFSQGLVPGREQPQCDLHTSGGQFQTVQQTTQPPPTDSSAPAGEENWLFAWEVMLDCAEGSVPVSVSLFAHDREVTMVRLKSEHGQITWNDPLEDLDDWGVLCRVDTASGFEALLPKMKVLLREAVDGRCSEEGLECDALERQPEEGNPGGARG